MCIEKMANRASKTVVSAFTAVAQPKIRPALRSGAQEQNQANQCATLNSTCWARCAAIVD